MKLSLVSIKTVCENTTELTFGIPTGSVFSFKAGQYLRLTLPTGECHDFSIASSPRQTDTLSIAFRDSASPFKKAARALKPGSAVDIDGPFGTFTLPDETTQPLVFVAGGIGITPFLSMLRFIAEQRLPFRVTLLYANTDAKRAAYLDELNALEHAHLGIAVKTKTGNVDAGFLHNNVAHFSEALWYIAGPPAMVQETRRILLSAGVGEGNIRVEEFAGYAKTEEGTPRTPYEHRLRAPAPVTPWEMTDEDLRALFDAVGRNTIISVTDARGDIIYANDMFTEVSGYRREELLGQNHRILKSGFHPPEFYEDLWRTISSGNIWRGEIKNRAKNGSFYWVDSSIVPIFDDTGTPIRYAAIRILITERKELEEKLRKHTSEMERVNSGLENTKNALMNILEDAHALEENLKAERDRVQTIILSIDEGIIVIDTAHTVTLINPKAAALLGTSADEAKGKDLRELAALYRGKQLVSSDERPSSQAMRKGRPVTFALTDDYSFHTRAGHTFPVAITAAPLKENEEVTGAVIVLRDVTAEKSSRKRSPASSRSPRTSCARRSPAFAGTPRCSPRAMRGR